MIASTRKWFRRNRTPFAIGVGVIGVAYVTSQYVFSKISDARRRISSDRIARENLRRRFEQNQEDCTFTVLALLPTATDNVLAELETERITYELQQQKAAKLSRNGDVHPSELGSGPPSVTDDDGRSMASLQSESGIHTSQIGIPPSVSSDGPQDGGNQESKPKRSKAQLWQDLKISAITRAFTLIYTLALLTLLTRIQLNLLGRRSYLSSVVSLATGVTEQATISLENNDDDNPDQAYGNDFETNRQYLTFSWWLLHRGWRQVMLKVDEAVKVVFGNMSPREDVSMQRFSEMVLEVRKKVEGATEIERKEKQWLEYLLPGKDQEEFVLKESGMSGESSSTYPTATATPLRRLLDETSDLIDSPPFSHVLTLLLDAGFSTLVDQKIAQQAYEVLENPENQQEVVPRIIEITEPKPVKLPKLLAILSRQAHSIGNGVPNEYLQSMEQVGDLEAFAAVVYSSNWETEIIPESEVIEPSLPYQDSELSPEKTPLEGSVVDIGADSVFESAWGKATETSPTHS